MATVEFTERRIKELEGFTVRFHYQGPARTKGRDVRGDRRDVPAYRYVARAKDTMTVAEWKEIRFAKEYPGFDVEVYDADDRSVHGRTLLSTVRATYR
jgi:hypothetical protein